MKIKFDSDDDLPLNKQLKFPTMAIVVRSVFEDEGKFYLQVYLDECLFELWMLEYDRIDISEIIGINKTSASKEIFVIIVILKMLVLSMNHIFATFVMI